MDSAHYLRFILSLVAVLGLIFGVLWVVRQRLPGMMAGRSGGPGRRLAVVESLTLDVKHRLVLVRRDDREHLLVLGGGQPVVVETDCPRAAFAIPPGKPGTPKPETGA
ncbi:flagellar biosynthetic protein FliO [Magnetospirillum sp. 15-1]|uniref:FliO/MopB family protein n=1 Tax=Magnetospirillum sp. 15-1 TaxID=1979370 RepID=UPI000BBC9C0E|nr:flagellar biosynthetic protein FliO [Magnetospirillum sp. 15-1]